MCHSFIQTEIQKVKGLLGRSFCKCDLNLECNTAFKLTGISDIDSDVSRLNNEQKFWDGTSSRAQLTSRMDFFSGSTPDPSSASSLRTDLLRSGARRGPSFGFFPSSDFYNCSLVLNCEYMSNRYGSIQAISVKSFRDTGSQGEEEEDEEKETAKEVIIVAGEESETPRRHRQVNMADVVTLARTEDQHMMGVLLMCWR
ncbi:uncharacterized protein V6R79_011849 [Siganus canaliculatus]